MNPLNFVARSVSRAEDLLKRHPRRLTAAVVTALLGTAVTAFGVAPMAPDAADLPRRLVTESVTPADLSEQLEALELHELELYRTDLTRSSDTADSLLRRLGVDDPEAAAFLRTDVTARRLLEGRAGKMVQVQTENGRLAELVARSPAADASQFNTHFTRLTVGRDAAGLHAKAEQMPLQAEVRLGSGTILSSLFAAADESRIPDSVTVQMAELFSADIDFRRELRRGDTFSVLYEALTADGEPITWNQAAGRVLAAQFVNGGKSFDAVWFQEPGSKGGYFGLDGRSKQRFFLASPMAFSRVTSGFAMRLHPIHKTWRAHLGVDYGAPTGTPVRSVGDGVVDFAGVQNGYGNVVVVQHPGNRQTLYAHLSRINVRKGQRVSQSDTVGLVGATGWATGPHLHFEFKVGGKQVDPMTIARSSEAVTISAGARARFTETAAAARAQLTAAPAVASARIE
ncbi:M23 family metallopeptidase [Methylibium rhizosphaerae]|uniref:M23 family metallopeptidase n=1 Tax=Methylibium rhizosphaerae TaxID=2570323 RepID=UPI00112CD488|nr:M23 family metallopeptidase [Methylibium rhizosphaerae]